MSTASAENAHVVDADLAQVHEADEQQAELEPADEEHPADENQPSDNTCHTTPSKPMQRKPSKQACLKYVGVFKQPSGRWSAQICVPSGEKYKYSTIILGTFDKEEEAAQWYDRAAIHLRKDRINFDTSHYENDAFLKENKDLEPNEFLTRIREVTGLKKGRPTGFKNQRGLPRTGNSVSSPTGSGPDGTGVPQAESRLIADMLDQPVCSTPLASQEQKPSPMTLEQCAELITGNAQKHDGEDVEPKTEDGMGGAHLPVPFVGGEHIFGGQGEGTLMERLEGHHEEGGELHKVKTEGGHEDERGDESVATTSGAAPVQGDTKKRKRTATADQQNGSLQHQAAAVKAEQQAAMAKGGEPNKGTLREWRSIAREFAEPVERVVARDAVLSLLQIMDSQTASSLHQLMAFYDMQHDALERYRQAYRDFQTLLQASNMLKAESVQHIKMWIMARAKYL